MNPATRKVIELPRRLASWALSAVALLCLVGWIGMACLLVGLPLMLAMLIAPAKAKPGPGLLVLLMNRAKEAMEQKPPQPEAVEAEDSESVGYGCYGVAGTIRPDAAAKSPS